MGRSEHQDVHRDSLRWTHLDGRPIYWMDAMRLGGAGLGFVLRGLDGAEEELGAVGAGAGVGHGEDTRARVLVDEVLVRELRAVDGLATGAVHVGEVTALDHEVRDDAVEGAALEAEALLARAQRAEVLRGLGGVILELHDDAARGRAAHSNVEENLSGH
eukprot:CAMPEP_0180153014 /NCGR_PEP_ID=MMETSP0986-20121125/23196_1 /TAXON_ID=697907 /ORGANISM="non described non described, Strain CCMP2293" /LENGTH=159 /DNA_ID=CAMNT_0022100867 /DNA_START=649 /DNA_END=1126 /DNA_ORIENTATION=-